jgi:transcriptional regulator with XRE-family HTH domain
MSFSEIAEATAIHPGQVSRICRGQFKTASASVMQICTFLGIPIDGLSSQPLEGDDYRHRLEQGIVGIWDGTSVDANRILRLLRLMEEFRRSAP